MSIRGLFQLSKDIGLSNSVTSKADKVRLEALHELNVAYNVYHKVRLDSVEAVSSISPVLFGPYQPIHTACAAAIETLFSFKHESGILLCVDESSALNLIELWRESLWSLAYGDLPLSVDHSDFGPLTNIGAYQADLNRVFGFGSFRVPFDLVDLACTTHGLAELRHAVGPLTLSQQSELLVRLLDLGCYESKRCAFRRAPDPDDCLLVGSNSV